MNRNKEKVVKTFFDLVQIDSPSGCEGDVRDYVINRLRKMGIKSNVDKAGNLFARIDGEGDSVLLSCHLDTVEPGRGVKPIIKNEVIISDGTTILGADNKVAVAAILDTLEKIKEIDHLSLEIVFSVREETDGGINEFDFKNIKSKHGIVADRASSLGTIVLAAPWIADITIEMVGKSAHSAIPEDGVSALDPVVAALSAIKSGRVDNLTTFNIGLIKGGSATNTILGRIVLEGEVRGFSKNSFELTKTKVCEAFVKKANRYKVKVDYKESIYCAGYRYSKSDRAVVKVNRAMKMIGLKTKYEKSFGGSDANTFIQNGIKVVNIGDGSKDAHTTKESVSIRNLVKLSELFLAYVSV